jgi:glycerol kinase
MVRDILEVVNRKTELRNIKVDGGMTDNDFLMQFQADIVGLPVHVPKFKELTALGAAALAAMSSGDVELKDIEGVVEYPRVFRPQKSIRWRDRKYEKWHEAVKRAMGWADSPWEN